MTVLVYTLLPVWVAGMVAAVVRVVHGPSLHDRVVALDLLASLAIGVVGLYAVATSQAALLEVAMVLALLSFLGTVAFAYFSERQLQ